MVAETERRQHNDDTPRNIINELFNELADNCGVWTASLYTVMADYEFTEFFCS